jgi:hypothetical protein
MRRLAIPGVVVIALLTSGVAMAGFETEYFGHIEDDPYAIVGFDVDKVNGKRKVRNIEIYAPYACHNGSLHRYTVRVDGSLRVRDQRFEGTRPASTKGISGEAEFSGKLKDGGRAKGSLRIEVDVADIPTPFHCYTGELAWEAEKQE